MSAPPLRVARIPVRSARVSLCRSLVLAACVASAHAPAQTTVIVPSAFAERDAPAMGELPGFNNNFRQQVVLRDRLLLACKGKTITGLTVRRDGQYAVPLRGGRGKVTIALAETDRDPTLTSPLFAENAASLTTVFSGDVEVPSAPALPGRDAAGWAPPHAVEFVFTTPFPYTGRHLVLEFRGEPVATARSPLWPVDVDSGAGSTSSLLMVGRPADLRVGAAMICSDFNPGGELTLMSTGPVGTSCVAMLGMVADDVGLDLTGYGAPGCRLHLTAVSAVSALYPREKNAPVSRVELRYTIPLVPGLFGSTFAMQWLQAPNATKPAGWTTTQAFRVRLGHAVPSCDAASLRTVANSPQVERGDVLRHVAPVLRLSVK